ncbi:Ger(x)C family spore germination protein [Paenibacillus oenotherae]|uniref:Ger(X)C family spore germination protein n=1 Tax=Paenibacillus oenotherae TaxID=1435645 RepID=A0ABS7D2Z2_9BACL|nr:Ger(x)C family spore germination protein [Paenibacillus oenotherae]MBW7473937.1 Ger(x)C family spore germination protein [Paenibacillus oenotherae]
MRWTMLILIPAMLLLSGCWDKSELVEFGYVQAVAIDLSPQGKFELTTQFYKSGGAPDTNGQSQQASKTLNIRTRGGTIYEAIRSIPNQLGREAKWDHMRVILVGERMARQESIDKVLDFFSRDLEPRGTIYCMIAAGKASAYLNVKPFVENTIGQQLRKMEETGAQYSSRTSRVPLLDLMIQLKDGARVATIPYVHRDKASDQVSVSGIALLKEGKLIGSRIAPDQTPALIMLLNKYKSGIVKLRCPGTEDDKAAQESFEVITLSTRVTPHIREDKVNVHIGIVITGSVGELQCSSLMTREEGSRFEQKVQKQVARNVNSVLALLQKKQLDALGIGNQIYRRHPSLWKKWKPSWDRRFGEIAFKVDVKVNVLHTGMNLGKPFQKEVE